MKNNQRALPIEAEAALATMECEGYAPNFEPTAEEAETQLLAAKQEAELMLAEYRRTGTVEPSPAYLKRPRLGNSPAK